MTRGRFLSLTGFVVGTALLCGCTNGPNGRVGSPPPASPASTAAGSTTSTSVPTCTNGSVVRGWPVERRASLVLVAPVLNFDMASARVASTDGAGGILFLGSASAPADLAPRLRSAFAGSPGPVPLAMADQEGGGIQRLTPPVVSMPWPRTMAQTMSAQQVQQLAAAAGAGMAGLGVRVDLAPVADVDAGAGPSASNPDGRRSFSGDPSTASDYTVAFMRGMIQAGEIPVVKHFPGLGGASGNTDNGPASTKPLPVLESGALAPFRAAIAAGAPAVMVANASVPGLTTLPAALSGAAVTGLLRGQLHFGGLVMTDSLSAGAITAAGYDLQRAAVASISAGADMVLFGSTLTPAETAQLAPAEVDANLRSMSAAIASAVSSGQLAETRLDAADENILAVEHISLC